MLSHGPIAHVCAQNWQRVVVNFRIVDEDFRVDERALDIYHCVVGRVEAFVYTAWLIFALGLPQKGYIASTTRITTRTTTKQQQREIFDVRFVTNLTVMYVYKCINISIYCIFIQAIVWISDRVLVTEANISIDFGHSLLRYFESL